MEMPLNDQKVQMRLQRDTRSTASTMRGSFNWFPVWLDLPPLIETVKYKPSFNVKCHGKDSTCLATEPRAWHNSGLNAG